MEASVEQRKTRAVAKWLRISPRKMRLVADLVRGQTVSDALSILKFTPNRGAEFITKVVNSAAANAENVLGLDRETLRVSRIMIDQAGPTLKRFQPVSRGMAHPILKRLSHIMVEVTEDEKLVTAKQTREETRKKKRGTSGRGRGKAAAGGKAAAEGKPAAEGEAKAPAAKRTRTKRPAAADAAKPEPEKTESVQAPAEPIEAPMAESTDVTTETPQTEAPAEE